MNWIIRKLDKEHLPMVRAFCCTETKEMLSDIPAKERRRIIKHSKEMEDFLKDEAYDEQENGLNTTHLFIDTDSNQIAAYVSLCNDSIGLEFTERDNLGLTYTTVPAVKIARLAVSSNYQHNGLGKQLIQFSAVMGTKIREMSGLAFITLDCYEHRLSFYESIGFVQNQIQPITLPYDSPISMRLLLDQYCESFASES